LPPEEKRKKKKRQTKAFCLSGPSPGTTRTRQRKIGDKGGKKAVKGPQKSKPVEGRASGDANRSTVKKGGKKETRGEGHRTAGGKTKKKARDNHGVPRLKRECLLVKSPTGKAAGNTEKKLPSRLNTNAKDGSGTYGWKNPSTVGPRRNRSRPEKGVQRSP